MKIIALDLGGTYIKAAEMNEKAEILSQWKVKSPTRTLEDLLTGLDECILPHLEGTDGIAISMPGKIDVYRGIAHTGGAYRWIKDLEVIRLLEERYHVPVGVDNDGKCAANAEAWVGALQDVPNGLVYVIGTGIGGGIVIDHQVMRGSHAAAGELSCCLKDLGAEFSFDGFAANYGSTSTLVGGYRKAAGLEEAIDGIEFFRLVHEGNETANQVFDAFCRFTANYFFTLQTVLDVDRIAIGGGISAEPLVVERIREEVHKLFSAGNFPLPMVEPEIVRCQYGNDANLIGAVRNFLDTRVLR